MQWLLSAVIDSYTMSYEPRGNTHTKKKKKQERTKEVIPVYKNNVFNTSVQPLVRESNFSS